MPPSIIEKFDDFSGIIQAGGGYTDVSKVDRDKLIELLHRLPQGPIMVTTVQGEQGALLVKHTTTNEPHWHCLAPIVEEEVRVPVAKPHGIRLNPKPL